MGLHNLTIAAPQLLAASGSSVIFWVLGVSRAARREGSGTVWVLRAGGLTALVALYMTLKLGRDMREDSRAYELRARDLATEEIGDPLSEV